MICCNISKLGRLGFWSTLFNFITPLLLLCRYNRAQFIKQNSIYFAAVLSYFSPRIPFHHLPGNPPPLFFKGLPAPLSRYLLVVQTPTKQSGPLHQDIYTHVQPACKTLPNPLSCQNVAHMFLKKVRRQHAPLLMSQHLGSRCG